VQHKEHEMAASLKAIKEAKLKVYRTEGAYPRGKRVLTDDECSTLHEAMLAIDGKLPGVSKRKGWEIANEVLDGHGIETIDAGNNAKSPWIKYVNMGDTYDTTVLTHGNRSTCYLGCWGDIVERGNYD
jgi:hypothetical protein